MITNLISQVLAASDIELPIGEDVTKNNFFGYTCIGHIVSNLVSASFIISGVAVFVMLVMGGMEYLTSGGDKVKTENAQKRITAAIIGLAIVASSYAVYMLVLEFFGINLDALCTDKPLGN